MESLRPLTQHSIAREAWRARRKRPFIRLLNVARGGQRHGRATGGAVIQKLVSLIIFH